MDDRQAGSPADSLVRFLNTLMTRSEPRSLEELRESAHAMGIDSDRLVRRARERLAQAREEARLSWVSRARAALPEIRQRLQATKAVANLNRKEQLQRIREAAEGLFGMPAREFVTSFHKFEELPDADLASLVEDIEMLRLLENEPHDDRT